MITQVYAAALTLGFIFMSLRVIVARRKAKIALGNANNRTLQKLVRAHANFAEYVPLFLILLFLTELNFPQNSWLHAVALPFVAGRIIHAYGVTRRKENFAFRVTGMTLTFTVLGVLAGVLLLRFFR